MALIRRKDVLLVFLLLVAKPAGAAESTVVLDCPGSPLGTRFRFEYGLTTSNFCLDHPWTGLIDFDGGGSVLGIDDPRLTAPDAQCGDRPYAAKETPSCGIGAELVLLLGIAIQRRRWRSTPTRSFPT